MIGCGIATMISALGLGFIGPRLPIVMGVFYIFIGPIVAISKEISLAAAMTALIIGGLVQFAWSPLIGKLHRFFPPIVTGTTILLIGTGLMKIGINVATGFGTPAFAKPLTIGLAALMIVLILVDHALLDRLRARAVAVHHHGDRLRGRGDVRPDRHGHGDQGRLGRRCRRCSPTAAWNGPA